MKKICIIAFLSLLCCVSTTATAQVGIKTNLLGWATASPNLGLEWGFGRKSTLNVSGSFNPFEFNEGKQWKHWLVQPEYRYWFCEKFNGHFLGFHLLGGEYNMAKIKLPFGIYPNLETTRYQVGVSVPVSPTVINGCCQNIGGWRWQSVWGMSIANTTAFPVRTAAKR